MTKLIQILSIFLFFNIPAALAGTVIQIQNGNELSTIMTDGKQARMNMSREDYVIVDYKTQSVKVVTPGKAQVMLLDAEDMPKGNKSAGIQTSIKHLGPGPLVAGYKTQKFAYMAQGRPCGVIYGSKDAFKVAGIEDLFNAIKTMMDRQQAVMGGFAGMMDDCTRADLEMSAHVQSIGLPMRSENRGVVDTEVKSIKLNVALPAATFEIPASYKTVTLKDEMQKASKDMADIQQQMQQHQPQMQQMMQQMQQSGQMSPQAMEQMRRAQEMMQQYQQPQP